MPDEQPQWANDHEDHCLFLGRYKQYDLYYAAEEIGGPTVVARFGNDGPEYSSGMCFGWLPKPEHPLVEARRRSQARGLDVQAATYEDKMHEVAPGIWATKDVTMESWLAGIGEPDERDAAATE